MICGWPSQNTLGMWAVLYWTQFGLSVNVWRLAGDTLNITCIFLYCDHQCTEMSNQLVYNTATLNVILYGCETWCFGSNNEHKLRVLINYIS
jgi:hypothetical protein